MSKVAPRPAYPSTPPASIWISAGATRPVFGSKIRTGSSGRFPMCLAWSGRLRLSGRGIETTPMDAWFSAMDAFRELSEGAVQELRDLGFVIIPGPVTPDRLPQLAEAYDSAMAGAAAEDVSVGSTTT